MIQISRINHFCINQMVIETIADTEKEEDIEIDCQHDEE